MTAPLQPKVEVKFGASGVNEVQRGLRLVGKEGESTARQVGGSMRQIAGGVEMIARQGRVTGEAMKSILAQGAEMAFAFGAAGPIVGALAITGLAIFEHITGNMKAAEEQTKKTNKAIGDLANSGDFEGLQAKAREIWFGTPFNEQGDLRGGSLAKGAFRGSLADLEQRKATLESRLKPSGLLVNDIENQGIFRAIKELTPDLERARAAMKKVQTAMDVMAGRTGSGMQAMRIEAAPAGVMTDEQLRAAIAKRAAEFAAEDARAPKMPGVQYIGSTATAPQIGGAEGHRAFGIKAADAIVENVTDPMGERLREGFSATIGDSISAGIRAGFESGNIGDVLKAGGAAILSGIGALLQQEGALWIKYGIIKIGLMKALTNPFTSGPAAIAAGALLVATGAAISSIYSGGGGRGGGGGGYGGSGGSSAQIIDRGIINPMGPMVSVNGLTPVAPVSFTVIGSNDPGAQRDIMRLIKNAQGRGVV